MPNRESARVPPSIKKEKKNKKAGSRQSPLAANAWPRWSATAEAANLLPADGPPGVGFLPPGPRRRPVPPLAAPGVPIGTGSLIVGRRRAPPEVPTPAPPARPTTAERWLPHSARAILTSGIAGGAQIVSTDERQLYLTNSGNYLCPEGGSASGPPMPFGALFGRGPGGDGAPGAGPSGQAHHHQQRRRVRGRF